MAENPNILNGIRLTEEDVRAVLQRASQYDGSVSVAELSSVAAEAGISEQAVVKAVMEVLAERDMLPVMPVAAAEDVTPAQSDYRGSWTSVFFGASAGMASGMMISGGRGVALMSIGVLAVGCIFRAFDNRREGSHRRFQLEASSCAAGLAAGVTVMFGLPQDVVAAIGTGWMSIAVLGGAIVSSAPSRTIGRFFRNRFGRRPAGPGNPYAQSFAQPRTASS